MLYPKMPGIHTGVSSLQEWCWDAVIQNVQKYCDGLWDPWGQDSEQVAPNMLVDCYIGGPQGTTCSGVHALV